MDNLLVNAFPLRYNNYVKPLGRISIKWSAKLAYAIGLIATDGCLYKDGRHINLTSKDIDQIHTFKKCLGIKNKIGLKNSGFVKSKKYYNLQFGDVTFYKFLVDIGLTPAKSKTLGELKISNKYFSDFLRGNHDGDGTFYSYWDKRWASSFLFYLEFISSSLNYIKWLKNKIYDLYGLGGYLNKSLNSGSYQLKYAKTEAKVIIKNMYYKNDIPKLARKFKKITKALNINNNHNARVL